MFRSVFHGDTKPMAVLALSQINNCIFAGKEENEGLWKGTFENLELLVGLELSTERQYQGTETTRIFGKRWEGRGANLFIVSEDWGWHRSCMRVIMSIDFSSAWIKSGISACCLTAASFILFFLTPLEIYSSFVDVPSVLTRCLWIAHKGLKELNSTFPWYISLCLIWGQCKDWDFRPDFLMCIDSLSQKTAARNFSFAKKGSRHSSKDGVNVFLNWSLSLAIAILQGNITAADAV